MVVMVVSDRSTDSGDDKFIEVPVNGSKDKETGGLFNY
jgi:hypothetical protein